jgi:hypothetical protein
MTTPSARSAAVRGDDYQYVFGWYWACRMLTDPDIESISIEDAGGGSFDDVVLRRRTGSDSYFQLKSSNAAATAVTEEWLTTRRTATGHSPLQHFYDTWLALRPQAGGKATTFSLVTNRGLDPRDPLLSLRDGLSMVVTAKLRQKGPQSDAGKAQTRWAKHLGITSEQLLDFLDDFQLEPEGGEGSWRRQAVDAMRGAGLRTDDDALTRGIDLVRSWVKTGAGPQSVDDVRRQVAQAQLLARDGTLVLAVHAIDRRASPTAATVELDWMALYDGDTPSARRQLRNPDDWQTIVAPQLAAAAAALDAFGVPRVHVTGSMRLPHWFAVGHALGGTRRWTLTVEQSGQLWVTDDATTEAPARILARTQLDQGPDLAVGLALTHDLTADVTHYLRQAGIPARELIVVGPDGEPGRTSVPDGAFAASWARAARELVRAIAKQDRPARIHLFLATPAGSALLLGHDWNLLPATLIYEHLGYDYAPTLRIG